MAKKIKIIFIFVFMVFLPGVIFSQTDNAEVKPSIPEEDRMVQEVMEDAIKKAIKEIEAEKSKDQRILASELTIKLDAAISEWLIAEKDKKTKELNILSHRDWTDLNKFTSPLPYDYYLRDFDYGIEKKDILKTDSFIKPYKAFVRVLEKLYVERYHSPDAAFPKQYYYTIFTPLNIILEYHNDKFVIVETESGSIDLETGWIKSEPAAGQRP